MARQVIEVGRPLSTAGVLLAGISTIAKRPHGAVRLPDVEYVQSDARIDPQHLADYSVLCGFDSQQGVPVTFPHMLAFPLHLRLMMRRDFPFPMAGLVHIANRIVQHRAIQREEPLAVRASFGALMAHPRGQALAIRAAISVGGEPLWQSESVYLRIGARDPVGPPVPLLTDEPSRVRERICEALPASLGPRYARISGDRNPIHMSSLGARLFGFKRRIAHGMWTKARAAALLVPPMTDGRCSIEVNFRAPILLPGTACFEGDADARRFAVRSTDGNRLHLIGQYSPNPPEDFDA
tara:strand:- start:145 stop:1029 length:885 start_codon:yes stop_codon:yes gene_type:complete